MGFSDGWIRWIKGCLDYASISVLVNGCPSDEFAMRRGIRQGDPLAPFLFLTVAEVLNGMMRSAVSKKKFEAYKVENSCGVEVAPVVC